MIKETYLQKLVVIMKICIKMSVGVMSPIMVENLDIIITMLYHDETLKLEGLLLYDEVLLH